MTLHLDERELTDFLIGAALTSPTTFTPAPTQPVPTQPVPTRSVPPRPSGHRALVVQGDVAFLPVHVSAPLSAWRPMIEAAPVPGTQGAHAHWLIPSAPGAWWAPSVTPGPLLVIPEGLSVTTHHTALPIEHEDLTLGAGTWSIRVQTIPTRHRAPGRTARRRAERYPLDFLWRLLPAGPTPTFNGHPINDIWTCG